MKKNLFCFIALCLVNMPNVLAKTFMFAENTSDGYLCSMVEKIVGDDFEDNFVETKQNENTNDKIDCELVRYSITDCDLLYLSKNVKSIKNCAYGSEWNFNYCEYNRQGYIIKEEARDGDCGGDVTTYTYNSKNQLIKKYTDAPPEMVMVKFWYNDNGLLVKTLSSCKEEEYDDDEFTIEENFFYDSLNNHVKTTHKERRLDYDSYNNGGNITYNYSYSDNYFIYDFKGNLIQQRDVYVSEYGKHTTDEYFIYDLKGNLIQRYILSEDGKDTTEARTFQYDENNNCVKECEYHHDETDCYCYITTFQYDENNNCVKECKYFHNEMRHRNVTERIVTREYKTDSFGRIVKIIETVQDFDARPDIRTDIIYVEYYD